MYSGIGSSVSYARTCFDFHPGILPRKEESFWDPQSTTSGYPLREISGDPCECHGEPSASLAYPQSPQRYSPLSNMTSSYRIPTDTTLSSHITDQQPAEMAEAFYENCSRFDGYYRTDDSGSTPTLSYPVYQPYLQSPTGAFHEYGMQPDDRTLSSNAMLQVFSVERSLVAEPLEPGLADAHPSTFTFQLGPNSLDEVEDPELSYTQTNVAGAGDESEWEESDNCRTAAESSSAQRPIVPVSSRPVVQEPSRSASAKNSKMHQCSVCHKRFPRPSGLATHMNSHMGLRPYKCSLQNCGKSFAVRSNAKRHLRTHGIIPTPESAQKAATYSVDFDTPLVSDVHDAGNPQAKLRWIPQSLTALSSMSWSRPALLESDSEDGCPVLPVPLLPSVSPVSSDYTDGSPYHPCDWRGLPGPALAS